MTLSIGTQTEALLRILIQQIHRTAVRNVVTYLTNKLFFVTTTIRLKIYRQMVTIYICFHMPELCILPHSVSVCSVRFSQQTATVSPPSINRLGPVLET
jgi:hypothetical protein